MGIVAGWAVVSVETGIVINTILWDGEGDLGFGGGFMLVQSDTASIGDSYANGVFTPPLPTPPTDAEIIASNTTKLQQANQLAAAQKTALTNRVSTLNDAVELEMATPAEIAELPVRQAQLLEWKRYAVYLGRITQQAGWALTVDWPIQPPEGMDLTVSAVAPGAPSAQ